MNLKKIALSLIVVSFSALPAFCEDNISAMISLNNNRQFSESLAMGKRLLRLVPKDERVHFNMGRALAGLKEYREAKIEYETAYALGPRTSTGEGARQEADKLSKKYPELQGEMPEKAPEQPKPSYVQNYGTVKQPFKSKP